MEIVFCVNGLLVLLFLYLFLIFPADGRKAEGWKGRYIAHRGLHSGSVVENTLPAFAAAIGKGYGIELDVQLSSDGVAVVCHDYDLKRVFGDERKVAALTAEELKKIGVPTFAEVLALIDGRVPLVAEMKGESLSTDVCAKAAELLDRYTGEYCIESFNPMHLRWFKKHRPQVVRGQLSTAFGKKRDGKRNFLHFFLRHLLLNFLSRPHFISYEHIYYGVSVRLCRLFGAVTACWTPQSGEECDQAKPHYDFFIFEGFEP